MIYGVVLSGFVSIISFVLSFVFYDNGVDPFFDILSIVSLVLLFFCLFR